MPKVRDACRHVRSKAAGPFWVTIDLFFDGPEAYARYHDSPALGPETFARLYGAEPQWVKRTAVDSLQVVKISYPRATPQGWITERDLHSGQQYVRLLDVELA
ncbi:DUF4387 domain-containing protein [Caulobacter sp. KR2-114]|uniref:DUF4387 domain-containing protein n=1 Tax=Caulobacter sp. KR2-114 TaxID=3400912 RepID=UPI003C0C42CE